MAIVVPIVSSWEPKGLEKAVRDIRRAEGGWNKTRVAVEKLRGPALAAAGTLAAAGAVAVKAASGQEQAFGALDSVFGKNAESMKGWAREQSKIGLSAAEAGNQAVLLGSLLKNSGDSAAEAAEKSQKLVTLGADLAATYGGSTSDAVSALSSAYKNSFDPLERFGVSLRKSDVDARLAAKGQNKLKGAALKAAEQAAISELIWEQTADAQGQAGREADTFAGAMGRLQAEVTNAAGEIGTALLPYVTQMVDALGAFAAWASENQGQIQLIAVIVGVLAAAIIALNIAFTIWTAVTVAWSAATAIATAVGTAFSAVVLALTAPITWIILAIIALIAVGVLLWKNWDKIAAFLGRVWDWIKAKAIAIWGSLKDWFSRTWQSIKDTTLRAWESIQAAVVAKVSALVNYVKTLPGRIVAAIGNFGKLLYGKGRDLIQGLINGIKSMGSAILNAILSLLPAPLRGAIRGAIGFTVPVPSGLAVAGAGTYTGREASGPVIIVNGALDPDATARRIDAIIRGHDASQGRTPGARTVRAW